MCDTRQQSAYLGGSRKRPRDQQRSQGRGTVRTEQGRARDRARHGRRHAGNFTTRGDHDRAQGKEDPGARNLTATRAQATGCGARREPAKWKTSRGRRGRDAGRSRNAQGTRSSSEPATRGHGKGGSGRAAGTHGLNRAQWKMRRGDGSLDQGHAS
jgi:hypothetical protein